MLVPIPTILHAEFLEAIRSVVPPGRWKILVVDEHSQKLLGSVLKQFDILEENVTRTSTAGCECSVHTLILFAPGYWSLQYSTTQHDHEMVCNVCIHLCY